MFDPIKDAEDIGMPLVFPLAFMGVLALTGILIMVAVFLIA